MQKIAGDAMLIEKEPFQVEIHVADFIISGTFTIFKGERVLSELNNEKRFIELSQCQVKDKKGTVLEKHSKLIVNKNFIQVFKSAPVEP